MKRSTDNVFFDDYSLTIGVEFGSVLMRVKSPEPIYDDEGEPINDDIVLKLQLWDTAG